MKNLLFGLIATVMFGFVGNVYGNDGTDVFEYKPLSINNLLITCFDVGVSFGVPGASLNVTVRVCCWRTAAQSPHFDCGIFSNKPEAYNYGYINVDSIDSKLLDLINKNEIKTLNISESDTIDGKFYIKQGNYEILTDKEGRYLKVTLAKT